MLKAPVDPRVCLFPLRLLLGTWFLIDCVRFGFMTPDWPGQVVAFIQANLTDERTTGPAGWMSVMLVDHVQPNAAVYGYAVVITEAVVGFALLVGWRVRLACTLGLALNLVFTFARGFGLIGPHIDSVFIVLEIVLFAGAAGLYRGLDAGAETSPWTPKPLRPLLDKLDANPQFALALLRIGTGAIFAVSAYDKWRRGSYAGALEWLIQNQFPNTAYGFYKPFLDGPVLANVDFFAWAVTLGETAIALALVSGFLSTAAAIGGIFLMLNIHLALDGNPLVRNADIGLIIALAVIWWSAAGRYWGLDGWRQRALQAKTA